jgi:hypothetical protein
MTSTDSGATPQQVSLDAVRALAGAVLPGDARFPSAAALPVAERIIERLTHDPVDAEVFARLVERTDAGATPEAALRTLTTDPAALQRALQCVYAAYYEQPPVRRLLEDLHGYPDRPPQPLGYRPLEGSEQLARLAQRAAATLTTEDWWLERFDGLDA